jgi:hypothetical protein
MRQAAAYSGLHACLMAEAMRPAQGERHEGAGVMVSMLQPLNQAIVLSLLDYTILSALRNGSGPR